MPVLLILQGTGFLMVFPEGSSLKATASTVTQDV